MNSAEDPSSPLTGSFGSTFWQIRVHPEIIPELAEKFDWNRLGRRVAIDPLMGLISWMTPSSEHAGYAAAADKVAERAGGYKGLRVKALRDTRWRQSKADPLNTGIEPDACFYVGPTADGWREAREQSRSEAREFEERTPPDLVVEIEWTQIDRCKALRYADLGSREMWRAERQGEGVVVEILDLQADGGPAPAAEGSLVFPGLDALSLGRILDLAERTRFSEMEMLLEELLSPPQS